RDPGAVVPHPARRPVPDRAGALAGGASPLLLPRRGPPGARRNGGPLRLPDLAAEADHLHAGRQRLGLRASLTRTGTTGGSAGEGSAESPQPVRRRARLPQRHGDGQTAVPGDRPGGRARLRRLSRSAQERAAAPGLQRSLLRRLPALRPRESVAVPGAPRGTGASAREQSAGPRPGAAFPRRGDRGRAATHAPAGLSPPGRPHPGTGFLRIARRSHPADAAGPGAGGGMTRDRVARLELAGEVLWLLPERVAYWERRRTLLL